MPPRDSSAKDRPAAPAARGAVTEVLRAWNAGELGATDQLMSLVYMELRSLAATYLRRERRGHTLQPTALVHEAFLRLVDNTAPWRDRAHFFGVAAQAMRRVLVDHARRRLASKRGPGLQVTLSDIAGLPDRDVELVNLDRVLRSLSALDQRQGQIVELRFFGGLSVEETAEHLSLSSATVKREWVTAKAWMRRELTRGASRVPPGAP